MPKFKQIELNNNCTLILWKITEKLEALLPNANLSSSEIDRLKQLKSQKRKKEWVTTRCLLNSHLGARYKINYTKDGAPLLCPKDYKISISHSDGLVGIILNKVENVGLDIQNIDPKIEKIKHKFLHISELHFLENHDHYLPFLHLIWCAKEVAFKTFNLKNLSFKENISIQPFNFLEEKQFVCTIEHNHSKKMLNLSFSIIDDYMIVYTAN